MKTVRASGLGPALALMVLVGCLGVHLASAQAPAGQIDPAGLQALVQTAVSARGYAQGLVVSSSAYGLDTSSARALIATGNGSLAAAEAILSSNGNLVAGLADVESAMKSFTDAAANASLILQNARLTQSATVDADLDAIGAVNGSIGQVATVVTKTCSTVVPPSLNGQFQQECASANASITNSLAELKAAAALLATPGADLSGLTSLLSQARGNASSASTSLAALSASTYPSRSQAFVSGPMAVQGAAANASVASQTSLTNSFKADLTNFQTVAGSQTSTADGIAGSAGTVASAISSVSMGAVTSSISSQQSTVATAQSDLTSLSQLLSTLPIPASALTTLVTDVTASQSSGSAYSSALSASSSQAGAFLQASISGIPSYAAGFNSASTATQSDGSAYVSSLATVQSQLGVLAALYPLISSLAQWQATIGSVGNSVSSGTTSVNSSLQAATSGLATLNSDISALTTKVQGVSAVEVSSAVVQDVTSVNLSENQFLNATALSAMQSALSSLQSNSQLATSFEASSQSLLSQTVGQFGSASQAIGSQAGNLKTQAQSTLTSMNTASAQLTGDLNARTQAVSSAQSLIAQATSAFGASDVPRGTSLLGQASAEFALAYSKH
jgi:hypothetical protein